MLGETVELGVGVWLWLLDWLCEGDCDWLGVRLWVWLGVWLCEGLAVSLAVCVWEAVCEIDWLEVWDWDADCDMLRVSDWLWLALCVCDEVSDWLCEGVTDWLGLMLCDAVIDWLALALWEFVIDWLSEAVSVWDSEDVIDCDALPLCVSELVWLCEGVSDWLAVPLCEPELDCDAVRVCDRDCDWEGVCDCEAVWDWLADCDWLGVRLWVWLGVWLCEGLAVSLAVCVCEAVSDIDWLAVLDWDADCDVLGVSDWLWLALCVCDEVVDWLCEGVRDWLAVVDWLELPLFELVLDWDCDAVSVCDCVGVTACDALPLCDIESVWLCEELVVSVCDELLDGDAVRVWLCEGESVWDSDAVCVWLPVDVSDADCDWLCVGVCDWLDVADCEELLDGDAVRVWLCEGERVAVSDAVIDWLALPLDDGVADWLALPDWLLDADCDGSWAFETVMRTRKNSRRPMFQYEIWSTEVTGRRGVVGLVTVWRSAKELESQVRIGVTESPLDFVIHHIMEPDTHDEAIAKILAGMRQWTPEERTAYCDSEPEHPLFMTKAPTVRPGISCTTPPSMSVPTQALLCRWTMPLLIRALRLSPTSRTTRWTHQRAWRKRQKRRATPLFSVVLDFSDTPSSTTMIALTTRLAAGRRSGCSRNLAPPVAPHLLGPMPLAYSRHAAEMRALTSTVYANLAAVYLARKKYITAFGCCEKALKCNSKNEKAAFRAAKVGGACRLLRVNWVHAVASLLSWRTWLGAFFLPQACLALGQAAQARSFCELVLSQDEGNAAAAALLKEAVAALGVQVCEHCRRWGMHPPHAWWVPPHAYPQRRNAEAVEHEREERRVMVGRVREACRCGRRPDLTVLFPVLTWPSRLAEPAASASAGLSMRTSGGRRRGHGWRPSRPQMRLLLLPPLLRRRLCSIGQSSSCTQRQARVTTSKTSRRWQPSGSWSRWAVACRGGWVGAPWACCGTHRF
jgi:hypothetical protein